jgi:glycosyltransferase involved in cell wall biosynthesis
MSPHRILFLGHSGTRSGAPILLLNLMRWIRDHTDFDLELLLAEGGALEREYAEVCPVSVLDAPRRARQLPFSLFAGGGTGAADRWRGKLLRRLSSGSLNLVYANTMTLGRLSVELSGPSRPVLTHVHEMSHWIERSGRGNLELVKACTSKYIAASVAVRTTLVEKYGISAGLVEVVHEFIPWPGSVAAGDAGSARDRLGILPEAFVVLGSGHETWRKGKDLFVRLAHECRAMMPERSLLFLWVGGWDSEEERRSVESVVDELGVRAIVRFVGQVAAPLDHFVAADLFAMVSREDPYPLVCLEAAARGVPIVCFAGAGGTPELVEDDAGRVVPYLDVGAMARSVSGLAGDEDERRRLGRRASEKVRDRHEIGRAAPRILEIVESTLAAVPR